MSNIKKRPNGQWRARYRDRSGREHARHFDRKVDGQRWLDEMTTSLVTHTYVDPKLGKVTVNAWAEKWFSTKSNVQKTTRDRYRVALDTHVLPRWGDVKLTDIVHEDIQEWIATMSNSGHKPASVRKVHGVLSQVLGFAVRSKRLAANPAVDLTLPTVGKPAKRYLRPGEVRDLAEAASPVWSVDTQRPVGPGRLVVLVLAYCGLRWGELAALKVGRLDMLRRRLHIEENVVELNDGTLDWKAPKSHETRWVPIPKFLVDDLAAHLVGKGPDDLVFTGRDGAVLRNGNARRAWFDQAVVVSECPDGLTPHELRHTAASLAVSAGANVKAVQRMLGHAKASMTLDVYADLFDDDLEAVADRLDEIARRTGGNLADSVRTTKIARAS